MKVRAGSLYYFSPCGWDYFNPLTNLQPGDRVRVVKLHGCPPPNTMNHCHVADPETGKFIGLVHTNSLRKSNAEVT